MGFKNNDRRNLQLELATEHYRQLLRTLQRKEPFFRRFNDWKDVIAFMRQGTSHNPQKDEILRPIFKAHDEDQDPGWRTILTAIFWPALESIHWKKRGWDPDPDDRWENILWVFVEVICRIDVTKRPCRLVQKVFNDTVHRLHDEYRREWVHMEREKATEASQLEDLAPRAEDIGFAAIELRDAQEAEIRRLQQHMQEGRISEADFFLLVGTRVYGHSVADYAREARLGYQVAKKRRQRAEATIRRFEEKQQS
jgi:hypothetical protein